MEISKGNTIWRVYTVPIRNEELFYMRTLLFHVKGPESFNYLKTVDNEI